MSIRRTILETSPYSGINFKWPPNSPIEPDALAYNLEGYLRTVPELGALDGFISLYVMAETPMTLDVVGLTYVLPNSLLPLKASLEEVNGGISYRVWLGSDDKVWKSLTESKRWKAVHQYATDGCEPPWNWNQPLEGLLLPQ